MRTLLPRAAPSQAEHRPRGGAGTDSLSQRDYSCSAPAARADHSGAQTKAGAPPGRGYDREAWFGPEREGRTIRSSRQRMAQSRAFQQVLNPGAMVEGRSKRVRGVRGQKSPASGPGVAGPYKRGGVESARRAPNGPGIRGSVASAGPPSAEARSGGTALLSGPFVSKPFQSELQEVTKGGRW